MRCRAIHTVTNDKPFIDMPPKVALGVERAIKQCARIRGTLSKEGGECEYQRLRKKRSALGAKAPGVKLRSSALCRRTDNGVDGLRGGPASLAPTTRVFASSTPRYMQHLNQYQILKYKVPSLISSYSVLSYDLQAHRNTL